MTRVGAALSGVCPQDAARAMDCQLTRETPTARTDPAPQGTSEKIYTDAVVTPPSTTMVWPVMKVEASEPR